MNSASVAKSLVAVANVVEENTAAKRVAVAFTRVVLVAKRLVVVEFVARRSVMVDEAKVDVPAVRVEKSP